MAATLRWLGAGRAGQGRATGGPYADGRELPEGPRGERISELAEVINSNDPERVKRFVNERFTERFKSFVPMEHHRRCSSRSMTVAMGWKSMACASMKRERRRRKWWS